MRELIDPNRGMIRAALRIEWTAAIPFLPVIALMIWLTCKVRL